MTLRNRLRLLAPVAILLGATLVPSSLGTTARSAASPTRATSENGSIAGAFISHARVKTRGATSQRDVVVYLKSIDGGEFTPPSKPITVKQRKLQFEPHVVPLLKGASVSFQNEDDVKHNVFSTESCS